MLAAVPMAAVAGIAPKKKLWPYLGNAAYRLPFHSVRSLGYVMYDLGRMPRGKVAWMNNIILNTKP